MAKQTSNFGFIKPELNDFYDVEVQNGNWDKIDALMKDVHGFVGYTDEDIYGVEVDFKNKKFTRLAGSVNKAPGADFNSVNAFGGRRRCNVTETGTVTNYYGDALYNESGKTTNNIDYWHSDGTYEHIEAGTPIQVMVEQPKFYYKVVPLELEKNTSGKGFHIRKCRYYISDTAKPGFKVHPVFIENDVEKDFIYLSAYEGCHYATLSEQYILNDSVDAYFDEPKCLSSIAGAKPVSGLSHFMTREECRETAERWGTGWLLSTIKSVSATQLLFLIEYASFDTQLHLGIGVTNKTDDGSSNMGEITGATATLGNASGSVTNDNGFNIISYRGEENFYGNIWTWIDNIFVYNYNEGSVYIANNSFGEGLNEPLHSDAGITISGTNGYVSAFGYSEKYDWLFIASECTGNSSLPIGDYAYQNKALDMCTGGLLGGNWEDGSQAGAFFIGMHFDPTSYSRSVGGRILYIPQ